MASDADRKPSVIKSLGISGVSACIAESVTLPLDTAKVRLQLQNRAIKGAVDAGPLQTVWNIHKIEGTAALFKGLEAGIHRQIIFTGLRVGLYGTILDAFNEGRSRHDAHLLARVGAAITTSAIGITLANPSDVVKASSLEARGPAAKAGRRSPATHIGPPAKLYKGSAFHVYRYIVRHEGVVAGLWSGYTPNLIRNSIISASELVTYDVSKREYQAMGIPNGPGLHLMSGLSAGLVATMLGNPMDVVSTRIMVRKSQGIHAGMVKTCKDMLAAEGMLSFYQGFVPNFARIGAFNVVLWMSLEQISALFA